MICASQHRLWVSVAAGDGQSKRFYNQLNIISSKGSEMRQVPVIFRHSGSAALKTGTILGWKQVHRLKNTSRNHRLCDLSPDELIWSFTNPQQDKEEPGLLSSDNPPSGICLPTVQQLLSSQMFTDVEGEKMLLSGKHDPDPTFRNVFSHQIPDELIFSLMVLRLSAQTTLAGRNLVLLNLHYYCCYFSAYVTISVLTICHTAFKCYIFPSRSPFMFISELTLWLKSVQELKRAKTKENTKQQQLAPIKLTRRRLMTETLGYVVLSRSRVLTCFYLLPL